MTLQTSGPISFQQINVELKLTATATISLNDAAVRKLLGKSSGTISMQDAYGKASEIRYINTENLTSASIYELMGSPTAADIYVFENNAEINASTASYALRTGVFPAGSTLTIVNNGYIRGSGGAGSSAVGTAGGAGGDAIYLDMACSIDNTNGYILAGGGGGGSAQRITASATQYHVRAGGGGGAGSSAGVAGKNSYATLSTEPGLANTAPQSGTATSGGSGGTMSASTGNYYDVAYGGAGGANGAQGSKGSTATTTTYKNSPTIGVAGAAGRAIITNSNTLTQVAGFGTDSVKGAIV